VPAGYWLLVAGRRGGRTLQQGGVDVQGGGRCAQHQGPGDAAEARAPGHLQRAGLTLVERNYRVARGPRARGGEIDLILRDRDGTLVFVEVRQRAGPQPWRRGGQRRRGQAARLVRAAQHYLLRLATPPPCRFDVVAIDGDRIEWLPGAFDAG
jgi:putative endonuclease